MINVTQHASLQQKCIYRQRMQSQPDPISEPILFSKSWTGSATKGHLEGVSTEQGPGRELTLHCQGCASDCVSSSLYV